MKKYLVVGDYVFSSNDADRHFVPAMSVAMLYKIHPTRCHMASMENPERLLSHDGSSGDLIALLPDSTGEYKIPADAVPGQIVGDSWKAIELLVARGFICYPNTPLENKV